MLASTCTNSPFLKIAAQTCVRQKEYGLAVSYCISAEDWVSLGRVIDSILEEYIKSGEFSCGELFMNKSIYSSQELLFSRNRLQK
jgi:hypothetical protein